MPTWALLLLLAPEGLRWTAPAECPSQADAAAYLRDELHGDPDEGSVDVVVTSTEEGWRAEVAIDDAPPRALEAQACEDVMAAAMVVVAVTRDASPEPTPAPEPTPEPTPVIPPSPEPEPEPEPEPTPEPEPEPQPVQDAVAEPPDPPLGLTHWIAVDAGAGLTHVPALSARVGARYMLRGEGWALRVGGHYETPRTFRYPEDFGGRFSAATGELAGCYEPGRGRLSGSICGGLGLGAVFGAGIDVVEQRTPRAFKADARAIAGLRWALTPAWRLSLDAMLAVGLSRPEFHVGSRDPLVQTPLIGGAGMIGIERRVP